MFIPGPGTLEEEEEGHVGHTLEVAMRCRLPFYPHTFYIRTKCTARMGSLSASFLLSEMG